MKPKAASKPSASAELAAATTIPKPPTPSATLRVEIAARAATERYRPTLPDSLRWQGGPSDRDLSIGIEEEAMLLERGGGRIAHRSREALEHLRRTVGERVEAETHDSAIEIATGVHDGVERAIDELARLRRGIAEGLAELGLRPAVAGTHPSVVWQEIRISPERRYERIHDAMRELARREPTFALHVHVGVADPDEAIGLCDRMRVHLPILLALSANSPFWQGRDSGLASSRIPLFQAFPRVGVPRAFGSYDGYVEAVAPLIESGAIPDISYLWWDIRPQPGLGTIELRIMDAQSGLEQTRALVAFCHALARLELGRGWASPAAITAQEVIEENRFLAARDGVEAELIDAAAGERRPLRAIVLELLRECAEPASELGCEAQLEAVERLLAEAPAARQRTVAGDPPDLGRLLEALAADYLS